MNNYYKTLIDKILLVILSYNGILLYLYSNNTSDMGFFAYTFLIIVMMFELINHIYKKK